MEREEMIQILEEIIRDPATNPTAGSRQSAP